MYVWPLSRRLQAINRRRAAELDEAQAQAAGLGARLAAAEAARDEMRAKAQVSWGRGVAVAGAERAWMRLRYIK